MFEKSSTIIRDASKFDYDYVPKNLVKREGQMHELEKLYRPFVESGRACNAFLMGTVGTGKTVTARKFCQEMTEYCKGKGMQLDTIYINCRSNNSENAVLLTLIRHFDQGHPDRGFSNEELARTLKVHLLKNKRPIVLILDEVDILLKKGTVDLIYQITRLSDEVEKPAPVSLILISQESIFPLLDDASVSTFRRASTVKFNKYVYDELRQIASERADEALYPGKISDDALDQIAESSEDYGDARMVIELLEKAAVIAEDDSFGEVTVENVRAAKALIYSVVSESKISTLDINRKVVLLAVARAMKQNVSIPITAAEKTYAIVCEEYELTARKHTQFWIYIQDLEKVGLVRTKVSSDGKSRTTLISLPDIPSKALAAKVAEIIDSESGGRGEFYEM